ncbi:hypothetical protein SDC9_112053 [bioreactor metagenome]|uniref:Uncharacterized protein n=1 Tax=bioreactor metagenome TaxID=1076179 RepID=A0A645BKU7_9ZZZZ
MADRKPGRGRKAETVSSPDQREHHIQRGCVLDHIRFSLQWPQQPCQFAAIAFAYLRVAQHERIGSKLWKRHLLVCKQRMSRGDCQDQPVMPYRLRDYFLANLCGMGEPDGEVARSQSTQLLGQRSLGQSNFNFRLFLATVGEERGQALVNGAIGYGDAQAALQTCRDGLDVLPALLQSCEHSSHVLQECRSGWGQAGSSSVPVEQRCAQFILKLLNGSGKGGLFNMQTFSGSGEM